MIGFIPDRQDKTAGQETEGTPGSDASRISRPEKDLTGVAEAQPVQPNSGESVGPETEDELIKTDILDALGELRRMIGARPGDNPNPRVPELAREVAAIFKLAKNPSPEQKQNYLENLNAAQKRLFDIDTELRGILSPAGEPSSPPESGPKPLTPEQANRELDAIGSRISGLFARGSGAERDRKVDEVPALAEELETVARGLAQLKATPLTENFPDETAQRVHEEALAGFTEDIETIRAILQRTIDKGERVPEISGAQPESSGETEDDVEKLREEIRGVAREAGEELDAALAAHPSDEELNNMRVALIGITVHFSLDRPLGVMVGDARQSYITGLAGARDALTQMREDMKRRVETLTSDARAGDGARPDAATSGEETPPSPGRGWLPGFLRRKGAETAGGEEPAKEGGETAPERKNSREDKPVLKILSPEEAKGLGERLNGSRTALGQAKRGNHGKALRKAYKKHFALTEFFKRDEVRPKAEDIDNAEKQESFVQNAVEMLGLSREEALAVYKQEALKDRYDRDRNEIGKNIFDEKAEGIYKLFEQRYGVDRSTWTDENRAELSQQLVPLRADLYQVLVVRENQALRDMEAKGTGARAAEIFKKSVLPYMSKHRYARMAATTVLLTGVYAMTPGVGLGAVGLYAGQRVIRTITGVAGAVGIGKGWDVSLGKVFKKYTIDPYREKMAKRAETFQGDISQEDEEYQKISKSIKNNERVALAFKLAVMIAGGAYVGSALGDYIYSHSGLNLNDQVPSSGRGTPGRGGANDGLDGKSAAGTAGGGRGGNMPQEQGAPANASGRGTLPGAEQRGAGAGNAGAPASDATMPGKVAGVVEPKVGVAKALESVDIQKGDSFWRLEYEHLEKQLDSLKGNPEALKAKFNLSPEDLQDKVKVRHALDARTAEILNKQGYIRADGTEVRIRLEPGARAVFDADDKVTIEHGHTYEWQPETETPLRPESGAPADHAAPEDLTKVKTVGPGEVEPVSKSELSSPELQGDAMSASLSHEPGLAGEVSRNLDSYLQTHNVRLSNWEEHQAANYYVTEFIKAHPGPFGVNAGGNLNAEQVARLMENPEIMQNAINYAKQCTFLERSCGFGPGQLRSSAFMDLRQVSLQEFLRHFPDKFGNLENWGHRVEKFSLLDGRKAPLDIGKMHDNLAKLVHDQMELPLRPQDMDKWSMSQFLDWFVKNH